MFDYPVKCKKCDQEDNYDNLKNMYDWLVQGYRRLEKRLAFSLEENRQLKIKLGERV